MTSIRNRACVVLIALAFVASPARADERTEARRHFRRGMQLIYQDRIDEGVVELEAAYAILPHPDVLYNAARAYARERFGMARFVADWNDAFAAVAA